MTSSNPKTMSRREQNSREALHLSKLAAPFLKKHSKRYKAGAYIYRENDTSLYVFVIINGLVKLTKKCFDSSEMQVSLIKPGKFAGLEAMFPYGYYYSSAIATTECTVCAIPKEEFLKVFNKYSPATLLLMDEFYNEMTHTEERINTIESQRSLQFLKNIYH